MSAPTLERPEEATSAPEVEGDVSGSDLARAARVGAAVGTPVMVLIVAAVAGLAAPGRWGLLAVAVWPALFAGWYFGAIFALGIFELRSRYRARRARRQSATA